MQVMIIGSGGREHALAWKAVQSPLVERVYVAPGNAGTAQEPKVENVAISVDDGDALCAFAAKQAIDLTLVGPEAPLVNGLVDRFHAAGLACFGPSARAAQLEGSKAFCKDFMARHSIPTAHYRNFTELAPAIDYIRAHGAPIVIKADGLAAGKGVVVAQTEEEAITAARQMLEGAAFGSAGQQIVIEEFLAGEEASFIVIADGTHALPLASSQDHKARDDGDLGPNTGGMGAYSPAPVVTPAIHARIMRDVIQPTLRGMAAEGMPYTGFLYAGVMILPDGGVKVLEFNCRLGDPETQPILMRLNSDLVALCQNALAGHLAEQTLHWSPQSALGVVLASAGYPESYRKGLPISGLPTAETPGEKIFHAGTRLENGQVLTDGGRVLCACALGDNLATAQTRAYALTERIHWDGLFYRRDIGHRALARG